MIVAVVPVKGLRDGKSRLAPVLTADERSRLSLDLAEHVVSTLRQSRVVKHVAVVTPEWDLALRLGVQALRDRGNLNRSLQAATEWAAQLGAEGLLIAPADLPCLEADDIRALVEAVESPPQVVLARGQRGGTGGLLLAPQDAIRPSFGEDSFQRHLQLAREAGIHATIIDLPGFAFDLDLPEDLQTYGWRADRKQAHRTDLRRGSPMDST